ncbi:MAG TPA: hypothetical protein V6C76_03685 [Drouetiella sp.]
MTRSVSKNLRDERSARSWPTEVFPDPGGPIKTTFEYVKAVLS